MFCARQAAYFFRTPSAETPSPHFIFDTQRRSSLGATPCVIGVANPAARYREDRSVRIHDTPFEQRCAGRAATLAQSCWRAGARYTGVQALTGIPSLVFSLFLVSLLSQHLQLQGSRRCPAVSGHEGAHAHAAPLVLLERHMSRTLSPARAGLSSA